MGWFPPRRGRPDSRSDSAGRDGGGPDRPERDRLEPNGDDDELYRHALERVAGPAPDPYLALRLIEPRLAGRRRPRALWVLGAAAAISVALALAGTRASDRGVGVRVVSPDDSTPSAGSTAVAYPAATTTGSEVESGWTLDASTTVQTVPAPDAPGASTSEVAAPNGDPGSIDTTTPDGADSDGSGDQTRPAPTTRPAPGRPAGATTSVDPGRGPVPGGTNAGSAPEPSPAPDRTTTTVRGGIDYPCAGGKVTITFDGRAMHLVAVTPTRGFAYEVEKADSDRIEVRFTGSSRDVRLRLSNDGGTVVSETDSG